MDKKDQSNRMLTHRFEDFDGAIRLPDASRAL